MHDAVGVIPVRSKLRCGLRPNGLRQDDFDPVASRAQALLRRKSGRLRAGSKLLSDDVRVCESSLQVNVHPRELATLYHTGQLILAPLSQECALRVKRPSEPRLSRNW